MTFGSLHTEVAVGLATKAILRTHFFLMFSLLPLFCYPILDTFYLVLLLNCQPLFSFEKKVEFPRNSEQVQQLGCSFDLCSWKVCTRMTATCVGRKRCSDLSPPFDGSASVFWRKILPSPKKDEDEART